MIVVTGGLGFIGNELVRQLNRAGKEILILDNKNRMAPQIEDLADIKIEEVDLTDRVRISDLFKELKPEIVFHLAAIHYIPECNDNPERTLRVNVEGTESILRAASRAGVGKVIFASSGAVYADSAEALSESSTIGPVDIYGWSKLFGEQLCQLNYNLHEMPIVVARLFNNYGPRETNPHIIPEIIQQLRSSDTLKLGNISTVRDYIHTEDCAESLIRLAQAHTTGISTVNVASGIGYTVQQVIELISKITGRSIQVNLESRRLRKFDKQIQVANIEKLIKLTNWQPEKTVEKGMENLLRFEKLI
jgi:UDP-glucose 4-epimerase